MVLGNFHGICRQILDKYLDFSPLKGAVNKLMMPSRNIFICRSLKDLEAIPGYDKLIGNRNEVAA